MTTFFIQPTRANPPIFATMSSRIDLTGLLSRLQFPVAWVLDQYLGGWLVVEVPLGASQSELEALLELPTTRLPYAELKANFDRDGYCKLPGYVNGYIASKLTEYYERFPELHRSYNEMPGIDRSSINDLDLMRYFHETTPNIPRFLVGEQIQPSYSFSSKYNSGSSLPAHIDNRPACTWNISLPLAASTTSKLATWPLHIKTSVGEFAVSLEAGDAVFYGGTRDLHWRPVMPTELSWVFGVFFHYAPEAYRGSLA